MWNCHLFISKLENFLVTLLPVWKIVVMIEHTLLELPVMLCHKLWLNFVAFGNKAYTCLRVQY